MSESGIALEFDDGLIPAIAQDTDSGEVLMLAYADREAVARTIETGRAHYYSRSRDELWEKGATSGNVQRVHSVRVDCDADTLLYLVDQDGGACHTGHRSCFYRDIDGVGGSQEGGQTDGEGDEMSGKGNEADEFVVTVETIGEEVFDPDAVYD